jgi:catechol 2,3-dioxygenase-like lactoylglutathione lyase family enzyme
MKKEGSLNHIEIYVNNLDKSYKFWNWFLKELGYSEFQKWDDGFSMILDSIYIVFVQTSKKYLKNSYNRCNTGLNHISFNVISEERFQYFFEELEKQKVDFLYSDKFPYAGGDKSKRIYFEDPDRMKVEIVLI